MTTARKVAAGGAWLYGAQLCTVLAQLIYASITSRLAGSADFGAYAVALSVSGFATLIATSGLGQAVGRMKETHPPTIKSLVSYAALVGVVGALLVLASAPLWALLYASDSSTAISFTAILTLTAPIFGLATGLLRRLGRFRVLALATLLSNLIGMAVGVFCVYYYPSAVTLLVSVTTAQLLVLGFSMTSGRHYLWGLRSPREARSDIAYSWKLIGTNAVSWANGNLVKIVVSRTLGLGAVGQWNRAEALTTVPFHQVQTAAIQAVYPEFRNFRESPAAARGVWTDLLVFLAWLVFPLAAVLSALAPTAVVVMFGPGWEDAAWISSVLALVGAVQILGSLLGNAIESLGRFKWIWLNVASILALQIGIAVVALIARDLRVAIFGVLLTVFVRHAIQVVCAARGGYVAPGRLVWQYIFASAAAGIAYVLADLALDLFMRDLDPVTLTLVSIGCSMALASTWILRHHLPPFVIARRYGLL